MRKRFYLYGRTPRHPQSATIGHNTITALWTPTGRDTMLALFSNVLWPSLHKEVVSRAKSCTQCQEAGKDLKPNETKTHWKLAQMH